ncbi:MAG: R3H domain-containing nucleic acid-binding protein [Patescibacteria group bacterium]
MNNTEITSLIKDLVEKTTATVTGISIDESGDGTTWFAVEVDSPHLYWNRGGEALLALNHLVRRIVENKMPKFTALESKEEGREKKPEGFRILIDINGFQKKRVDNVRATAHMMAERARYFKSNIEVDPMSAFERRIVHEFLSDATDLKTESMGEGSSRRVVIKYLGSL